MSLLPEPGTTPPDANFGTAPKPPALAPAKNPPNPLAIFIPAKAVMRGSKGVSASDICSMALARLMAASAIILKPVLSVMVLNVAKNSSLSFVSFTARVSCAASASLLSELDPASAVL